MRSPLISGEDRRRTFAGHPRRPRRNEVPADQRGGRGQPDRLDEREPAAMRSPLISGEDLVAVVATEVDDAAAMRSPLISGEDRPTRSRRRRSCWSRNEVPADQRGGRRATPTGWATRRCRNEVPADQRGGPDGTEAAADQRGGRPVRQPPRRDVVAAMRSPLISGEDRGPPFKTPAFSLRRNEVPADQRGGRRSLSASGAT